jgi:hypothetical protein
MLIFTACSSIREPVVPEALYDADNNLIFALRLEADKQIEPARQSYLYAYGIYQSFSGVTGQLACLSGLARLDLAEGDIGAFNLHKEQIEGFIRETAPALDYYLVLLQVYQLQQNKDYTSVSSIAINKAEYPLAEKVQLATAKLQADSYLNKPCQETINELKSLAGQYHKQVKKGVSGNYELLSTAWYSLAYHYFLEHNLSLATKYIDYTRDWDYRYGNFSGLGHALWLKGQIANAEGKPKDALSWLRRAEGIFNSLGDKDAETAVQAEIAKLKGASS